MFALIESGPGYKPGLGWTGKLLSAAVHASLITAAIAATGQVRLDRPPTPRAVHVVWPLTPHVPVPLTRQAPGLVIPAVRTPSPIVAPLVVPPDLPPPLPVAGHDPGSPAVPGSPLFQPGSVPGAPIGGSAPPLEVRLVDEPPLLLSHPAVRYPDLLRQAGIQGRVTIETVLDTLGRAEPALTRVASGVHELLDREAAAVVLASRYRAARVQGRAVRVRVLVPVSFSIRP